MVQAGCKGQGGRPEVKSRVTGGEGQVLATGRQELKVSSSSVLRPPLRVAARLALADVVQGFPEHWARKAARCPLAGPCSSVPAAHGLPLHQMQGARLRARGAPPHRLRADQSPASGSQRRGPEHRALWLPAI